MTASWNGLTAQNDLMAHTSERRAARVISESEAHRGVILGSDCLQRVWSASEGMASVVARSLIGCDGTQEESECQALRLLMRYKIAIAEGLASVTVVRSLSVAMVLIAADDERCNCS